MKNIVIVGLANAGKTRFVIEWARYTGLDRLEIVTTTPAGTQGRTQWAPEQAIAHLTGKSPHQTVALQTITTSLPMGKGVRTLSMTDTTGLAVGIHPGRNVREGMAQTLDALKEANAIFHMMDASYLGQVGAMAKISDIDRHIAGFASARGNYCILANKMDAAESDHGLAVLRQQFPGVPVFPISCVDHRGFEEVARFVRRHV